MSEEIVLNIILDQTGSGGIVNKHSVSHHQNFYQATQFCAVPELLLDI